MLQDPEVLAACMPGCEGLARIEENTYAMKMKMALAAITGQFTGTVRIADQNPPASFRLIVEGNSKIGFVKGEGRLILTAEGDATSLTYDGDVHVGGAFAAVGQRLLDTTAKMMIKRFFEKLCERAAG
ncbi:MAG: carbon monoxide dehydrogenase subunit G [Acidobacteria bacterium]|nr:carbon monoxide dehydrogenase subunit G [Acidobacteriota bacterium]